MTKKLIFPKVFKLSAHDQGCFRSDLGMSLRLCNGLCFTCEFDEKFAKTCQKMAVRLAGCRQPAKQILKHILECGFKKNIYTFLPAWYEKFMDRLSKPVSQFGSMCFTRLRHDRFSDFDPWQAAGRLPAACQDFKNVDKKIMLLIKNDRVAL